MSARSDFIFNSNGFVFLGSALTSMGSADKCDVCGTVLAVTALLYCVSLWVGARSMERNVIFSSTEQRERTAIEMATKQLSSSILQLCSTGPVRQIVFDDSDVLLPYLLPITGETPLRCKLVRETNVTPFAETPISDCSTIRVREYTSVMRGIPPTLMLGLKPYGKTPWRQFSSWISAYNDYGFALFVRPDCMSKGAELGLNK
jgi:hypothetical protein